jgi:hypothetical protein
MHAKMDPPAISARDHDGIATALTVDVQQLLLSADGQVLGRLCVRRLNMKAKDRRRDERSTYQHRVCRFHAPSLPEDTH